LTILAGFLLFLSIACGKGQERLSIPQSRREPVELSASVDKAVGNPGDIITLTLSADYQPDVSLELPEVADKFKDFRIVNSGVSQPTKKGDRLVAERWYKLQADLSGSYVIEPIEIGYRLAGGEQKTAKTPKIFLEVESLLAKQGEAKDIRDIKPPMPTPPSYRLFVMILAILAGIIALLVLGRMIIERLKNRSETGKLIPKPAHEEAFEALERLLKKRLIEKGHAREFCFEISEIFRRYIQGRFGIPAIDLTTEEILPRVESDGIIADTMKPVAREFLTDTDMVKFAKYQPSRNEIEKIVENTRIFIETTKMVLIAQSVSDPHGGTR